MIGMSQIRKRLIYGIAIGLGVGVIGIVITLIWSLKVVKSYKEGTNKDYIANYMVDVVMLNKDVIQGEKITDNMLTTQKVHKNTVPTDQAGYAVVGKIAKYNIPANIPLINSMFGEDIVSTDERIQEVSSINLPTGLVEGEYIDVKMKMASGLEYVVLPQAKVEKIYGTSIWLYLGEEDLYYLNSAIVDTYLSQGAATLYGVRYVDPTTQIKLDDNTAELAKLKLSKKIEEDVENGKVALTVPDEVTSETAIEDEEVETSDVKIYTEKKSSSDEKKEESKEYVDFSNNLSKLILTYAIEYRYYVESYNKVERTYQPSSIIMEHMKSNNYITDEAKSKLDEDIRKAIEEKMEQFESSTGDNYESAISGLSTQISAQQAIRNSTLTGQ